MGKTTSFAIRTTTGAPNGREASRGRARRVFAAAVAALGAAFAFLYGPSLLAKGPATSGECGRIAAVQGTADVLRLRPADGPDVRIAVRASKAGFALRCDDVVATGPDGGAILALPRGRVSMAPNSRVEIVDGAARIALSFGRIRAVVPKASAPSKRRFEVKTFSAVVGVRGTDFFAAFEPNEGVTEQATIEGSVEVRAAGSDRAAVVGPGQQTVVDAAKPEPLKVVPIGDAVRSAIQTASAVAKDEPDFAHPKAVEILGPAREWTIKKEPMPDKLRNVPNEF